MTICSVCKRPLLFEPGNGWLHPGGGLYVQRCAACGEVSDGPTQSKCPKCGSRRGWGDDHCAHPMEVET